MPTDEDSPEQIIMEANIREFGHKISMICALETGGKITSDEAYTRIKANWKHLKASRKNLLTDPPPPAGIMRFRASFNPVCIFPISHDPITT